MNREISAPTVRLVGLDGQQLGVVSLNEALELARQAGYDLAEIAPNAQPPVAKILDWGKYKYEQTKLQQKSKKNQKLVEVKQVRLGLKIGEHDLMVKVAQAKRFIAEGHKVKVNLRFRGREIARPELGRVVLERFAGELAEVATPEQSPSMTGRELSIVLGIKKDAETKNS